MAGHNNYPAHNKMVSAGSSRKLDEPIIEPLSTPRLEQLVITSRSIMWLIKTHSPPSLYPSLRQLQELNGVSFPDLQAGNLNYTSMDIIDQIISAMAEEVREEVCILLFALCFFCHPGLRATYPASLYSSTLTFLWHND